MGKLGKYLKSLFFISILFCADLLLTAQVNSQNENNISKNAGQTEFSEDSIFLDMPDGQNNDGGQNQNQNEYKSPSTIGVFIRMIVVLLIVVLLIYAFFWFVKKKNKNLKTEDDYLRRVAYLNIAPGKSVEVITLIDKAFLIGVTDDNISLLGEIDDKELITAMNINSDKKVNTKKPATFNEVLDLFIQKGNKKKSVFSQEESKVDNLFTENSINQE